MYEVMFCWCQASCTIWDMDNRVKTSTRILNHPYMGDRYRITADVVVINSKALQRLFNGRALSGPHGKVLQRPFISLCYCTSKKIYLNSAFFQFCFWSASIFLAILYWTTSEQEDIWYQQEEEVIRPGYANFMMEEEQFTIRNRLSVFLWLC
jgi:hypothetical protein